MDNTTIQPFFSGLRPRSDDEMSIDVDGRKTTRLDTKSDDEVVSKVFYEEEEDREAIRIPRRFWSGDGCKGFDIYLEDIPKDVKIIRVYQTW